MHIGFFVDYRKFLIINPRLVFVQEAFLGGSIFGGGGGVTEGSFALQKWVDFYLEGFLRQDENE